jgi:hypothetical protein
VTRFTNVTQADARSRFNRLPFVLLLTFGLLVSLIHCAGCDVVFANTSAANAVSSNTGAPDAPEQALPCHSGHCLSHVNAQMAAAVSIPADHAPRAPLFFQQQSPAALAGLPLFKPPRPKRPHGF